MIDLRQLRYFVMVAEELHFGRAAKRLNMTQPPLTQRIQALERTLNVQLLKRNRRRVELTDAGQMLLAEARVTLSQAAKLMTAAERLAAGQIGRVRVGYSMSASFLPAFTRAVQEFRKNYPDVMLDLSFASAVNVLGALERQELDICVTRPAPSTPISPSLEQCVIQHDRLMCVLPAAHSMACLEKISLRALADAPLVLRKNKSRAGINGCILDLFHRAGLTPNVGQEADDAPTIIGLVAAGVGVSILPDTLRAIRIDDVVWKEIDADQNDVSTTVLMLYRKSALAVPAQARFIQSVRDRIPEAAAQPAAT